MEQKTPYLPKNGEEQKYWHYFC